MFDNSAASLPIAEKLLKLGGDPNVMLDDETLFDRVDFDIVFGAVEQEDREKYSAWVKYWFLLMGYGGRCSNGIDAVNFVNGFTYDIFKEYKKLDFNIDFSQKEWVMHIFLRENGEEVAFL